MARPPPFDFDHYEQQRALDDIAKALAKEHDLRQQQLKEIAKAVEEQNLRALDDIAKALEEQNLRQQHLTKDIAKAYAKALEEEQYLRQQLLRKPTNRWATDMEFGARSNYYILWSTGEVTDGGTLP